MYAFITLSVTAILSIVVSSWMYEELVYNEESLALKRVLDVKYIELNKNLSTMMIELGLGLQSEKEFKRAIIQDNKKIINQYLNNEFHQYYVTAEVLRLEKIYLLNKELEYIGESSEGYQFRNIQSPICAELSIAAKKRKAADRLKPISRQCKLNNRAFLSIIVPVGTLLPIAYLQVVVDPVPNLIPIENDLNLRLRISSDARTPAYISEAWPKPADENNYIFTNIKIKNMANETVYRIEVAKPIYAIQNRFTQTTILVLSLTGVLIFIVFILTFKILKNGFNALSELDKGSQRVASGDYKPLEPSKYLELDSVINSFNLMSRKVQNNQYTLEQEVKNATTDLSLTLEELANKNKELSTAMQLSEQANQTKSTFLSNMSHELRTPLNAIIGYSEMLKEEADEKKDETTAEDLDKILRSGKHLLNIVNEILDLSKIEAGKVDLFIEEFDLAILIRECTQTAKQLAEKNSNQISLKISHETSPVTSDMMRVKQILFNLISNACKFTQKGKIDISVTRLENNKHYEYCISVKDSGIGLKESDLPDLFTPFIQADISTTKEYGGTGLGLALSKQFVELLGGTLTVKSTFGEGSEFTIQLPKDINLLS